MLPEKLAVTLADLIGVDKELVQEQVTVLLGETLEAKPLAVLLQDEDRVVPHIDIRNRPSLTCPVEEARWVPPVCRRSVLEPFELAGLVGFGASDPPGTVG
ncbi:hypothetical protein OG317_35800 [Streptomyces sp. NBC_01167]|uniref:hypothetical protein n=1 Tax=Streptomyces sp. NBC_01167 TaxID=2903756 RepID=UPI00386EA541|nr:hypothetical protein OG317_35800 [Streptomyces sp. NBC_01167]